MKIMAVMFNMFVTLLNGPQDLPNFLNKSEKSFVKNVINVNGGNPVEITKIGKLIEIEFKDTKYTLSKGFIDEVWIKENGHWISLGKADEAY